MVKKTLLEHSDILTTLLVLGNGNFASGSWDNLIKIWNPLSSSTKRTIKGQTGPVQSIVVLKNNFLASASYDGTIKIWDLQN